MKNPLSHRGAGAFTLVEMLTVIAIIAILAALLLPVLQRSKERALRVECLHNLSQLGVAYHSFAHDHGSHFPAQTTVGEGGAKEFLQTGYLVDAAFTNAYRNYLPLAGDLAVPKMLICPADMREAATNFTALQNSNLSYFVGVGADYFQPESVLGGDRNLVGASSAGGLIIRATDGELRWNGAIHKFQGNLLFADGHVEESRRFTLAASSPVTTSSNGGTVPPGGTVGSGRTRPEGRLRSAVPPANSAGGTTAAPGHAQPAQREPAVAPGATVAANPPGAGMPLVPFVGGALYRASSEVVISNYGVEPTNPAPVAEIGTNAVADDDAEMSEANRHAAKYFRMVITWGYLWLVLLILAWLVRRLWRRWQERQSRRL